ncbi:NAD(P)H-quinone oxidoreductase subunit 3 [archaeon BMS3Abin16]|nr:NAD(P)H-quinone oxidoreductase subunit 3 [archaeon BMS3Abin16]HDY74044.1 NADH-quinone oxidoreductase subunit A [Euryarchaeota archaeon]
MVTYEHYIPVVAFIAVGILIPGGAMIMSWMIRTKNPYPEKLTTYECGEEPIGTAQMQFDVQYYIYALLFVVFDVETVFLYPWAVVFTDIGMIAVVEMVIFIAMLLVALVYAWKKGILEWTSLSWREVQVKMEPEK